MAGQAGGQAGRALERAVTDDDRRRSTMGERERGAGRAREEEGLTRKLVEGLVSAGKGRRRRNRGRRATAAVGKSRMHASAPATSARFGRWGGGDGPGGARYPLRSNRGALE